MFINTIPSHRISHGRSLLAFIYKMVLIRPYLIDKSILYVFFYASFINTAGSQEQMRRMHG